MLQEQAGSGSMSVMAIFRQSGVMLYQAETYSDENRISAVDCCYDLRPPCLPPPRILSPSKSETPRRDGCPRQSSKSPIAHCGSAPHTEEAGLSVFSKVQYAFNTLSDEPPDENPLPQFLKLSPEMDWQPFSIPWC